MRSGLSSLKGSWMGRDNQAVYERKVWMIPRRTHLNLRFEFIRLRPRTPRPHPRNPPPEPDPGSFNAVIFALRGRNLTHQAHT